jgi:hypothetical protein
VPAASRFHSTSEPTLAQFSVHDQQKRRFKPSPPFLFGEDVPARIGSLLEPSVAGRFIGA